MSTLSYKKGSVQRLNLQGLGSIFQPSIMVRKVFTLIYTLANTVLEPNSSTFISTSRPVYILI
jgi:hypothetical protein